MDKRKLVPKWCVRCGKAFLGRQTRQYCSRRCAWTQTGLNRRGGQRRPNGRLPDRRCPGCGQSFRPRKQESKYCTHLCACAHIGRAKRKTMWSRNAFGYIVGYVWEDGQRRNMKQHRYVMEQHLRRRLLTSEHVHHLNGDRADNRLENLVVIEQGAHMSLMHGDRPRHNGRYIASGEPTAPS